MNLVDRIVAYFAPHAGVRRAQMRNALAHYEAAKPGKQRKTCLLYTYPSPRDRHRSRMPL